MEINTIAEFKKNFYNIYHSQIVRALEPFEKQRKEKLKTMGIVSAVGIIVICILLYFGCNQSNEHLFMVAFLCIFGIIFSLFYMQKTFETDLKKQILPILLRAFGNLNWTTNSTISYEEINDSKLFPYWEDRETDDNFYGTYNNMPLNISETKLTYTTRDSKGRRETHTAFKGAVITIGVEKNFTGHTIVRRRAFLLNQKSYQEVKLEDPEFSKMFFVDSNDQIEARYVLTTAFMERFKNIKNAFGARHAECCFKDKKLMIALSTTKDLFVLGNIFTPVNDTKQFMIFLKEIISIYEMIDCLKLQSKTGL